MSRRRKRDFDDLLAPIVHDMNNLLVTILASVDLVEKSTADPSVKREVEAVATAAEQLGELVQGLASCTKPAVHEWLDLNGAITSVEPLLRRIVGDGHELAISLSTTPAVVYVDRREVLRTLLNLVMNARDALEEPGVVRVLTTVNHGTVRLSVLDTGVGMSTFVRRRLLQDRFTTKAEALGSGLGLHTLAEMVRRRAVDIEVASHPNLGTAMHIDFRSEEIADRDRRNAECVWEDDDPRYDIGVLSGADPWDGEMTTATPTPTPAH